MITVQWLVDRENPKNVKDIQIFIGFTNFYWRYIENFSKVWQAITDHLEGDSRDSFWDDKQSEAFSLLKAVFTAAPILCHFALKRENVVEIDASDVAVGDVISQVIDKRQGLVAFHSQ